MPSRVTATVRGSHEDMMLGYLGIGARMHNEGGAWRRHRDSAWFPTGDSLKSEDLVSWKEGLEVLPYTLTITHSDGRRVGLVHGYGWLVRPVEEADWFELRVLIRVDEHMA